MYVDDGWVETDSGSHVDTDMELLAEEFNMEFDADPKKFLGMNTFLLDGDVIQISAQSYARLSRIWKDFEHGDGAIWKRLKGLADDVLQSKILSKWPRRCGQLRLAVQDAHAHQRHGREPFALP